MLSIAIKNINILKVINKIEFTKIHDGLDN
mgnify:CR=1 FL=1